MIEGNCVRSKSTVLTNAHVRDRVNKDTRLSLDVFNLFNRQTGDIDYFYSSQLAGEAAPVHDIHFHPVGAAQLPGHHDPQLLTSPEMRALKCRPRCISAQPHFKANASTSRQIAAIHEPATRNLSPASTDLNTCDT